MSAHEKTDHFNKKASLLLLLRISQAQGGVVCMSVYMCVCAHAYMLSSVAWSAQEAETTNTGCDTARLHFLIQL